ncbi:MAG: Hsp20/alpha crystallin family protein [Candidatus Hodarchaeales archaeon]|jgi:HSP20 family protein
MRLVRYNPFNEIRSIQNDIDRFFFGNRIRFSERYTPATDLYENADSFLIKMDIPGINKEDLKIESDAETMDISYRIAEESENTEKTEKENEKEEITYLIRERLNGQFKRHFHFPSLVDPSKSTLKLENGVLTIEVPKAEEAKRVTLNLE